MNRPANPASAKRPLLVLLAIACFAAAGVLTPSSVRSQFDRHVQDVVPERAPVISSPPEAIAPAVDAFAPRAAIDPEPKDVVPQALPMRPPPPPAKAAVRPRAPRSLHVSAIATGSQPAAIVDDGTSTRAVTVGDLIDGSAITNIAAGAVTLADGRRLVIVP